MKTSRITRKFERMLFKGVPEQPEHSWERNEFAYVSQRVTGKAPIVPDQETQVGQVTQIGYFEYDHEKQTEKFIRQK